MKWLKAAFAVSFIMISVLAPAVGGAQITGRDTVPPAREALQKATRSLDLQTELPGETKAVTPENERFTASTGSGPLFSKGIAQILLLGAVFVIIAVIAMNLKDNLWSSSRSRKLTPAEQEEIAPVATAARMDKAQIEADELARAGDYAGAMHMLLLQSLNEMRRRMGVSFAVSLTSREILHAVGLPQPAERALADIINRVEITYFGGRQPSADDYYACRGSFESLSETLRSGGGAQR